MASLSTVETLATLTSRSSRSSRIARGSRASRDSFVFAEPELLPGSMTAKMYSSGRQATRSSASQVRAYCTAMGRSRVSPSGPHSAEGKAEKKLSARSTTKSA